MATTDLKHALHLLKRSGDESLNWSPNKSPWWSFCSAFNYFYRFAYFLQRMRMTSDDHAPKADAREWWIATRQSGKCTAYDNPGRMTFSTKTSVVHVIEKSAYDALQKRLDELLSYLPKVPTQAYEKELAKQNLELQKRCEEFGNEIDRLINEHADSLARTNSHFQQLTDILHEEKVALQKANHEGMRVRDNLRDELAAAKERNSFLFNENCQLFAEIEVLKHDWKASEAHLEMSIEQLTQANARIKELEHYRKSIKVQGEKVEALLELIKRISGACGAPDAADACRNILGLIKKHRGE